MIGEGVRLAAQRRPVFKQLIKEDPRRALENAVPMVVRQRLPAEIVARLEARVNGVAALRVLQGVPLPGEPLPDRSLTFREAEFKDGKTYRAYVYGRRAPKVEWTNGASIHGVAVDADFAVHEEPSRKLEVGEIPNPNKPAVTVCPISGKTTEGATLAAGAGVGENTSAVETGTEIVHFCGPFHIDPFNQTLIMGEGVSGGTFGFTGILPAAPTPALGVVKVLAIPMTYADQNAVPATEATLYTTLRDTGDFYAKASFGRLTLVGVVTPPVKLPHNEAWYVNRDSSNGGDISGTSVEHSQARDEARKMGFDSNDYDCVVVRHNGGPGSYGGLGGGSSVWARSDSASLWAHEIGHCFALGHSNFWDTAGTSSIGAGTNQEYGDSYDNMGGGPFPAGHYNAQAKSQVKWLPSNFVQGVSQSGQYRLYAFDQGALLPDRSYALTIVKDSQKTYWGEVRSLIDTNPWVKSGMLLGWRYPNGGGGNLQRIDSTPGSPFLKEDAPISLGSTFSDQEAGIHITTIGVSDSPRYMDVLVNFGQFPGNQKPVLALAASADVVPTGATVTFTATASDPDGDALAYSWQHFGDTNVKLVSGNSPVITRTFSTAGTYLVSCTASDMKGGSTTRSQLITVGNGNGRFTISGRVTLLGAGLQDVVITANGANGVVTDADGYYTIPNLAANTYTMAPLLYGFTFGELFNNSVTVGPSAGGANFEATATPVVTIAATIPNANEAAPVTPGRFTITRTGDISQALVVNVNTALGSATKTTDYTFSPDYVAGSQGFSTFTILEDSATLDIAVTPVVDTAQEGPDTVILQLGPGNGYLVGTQSSATVVINDDDTALPKVSIAATTVATVENSGQPAVLTFSRTGATTASLTVDYTASGTAASGADFTPLTGSVVFPIGAASAVVNVSPIDNIFSEPLETVKLTTSTNAAVYLIDPLATNATVSVIDDDVQTVTVLAMDPSAKEVDLSVGGAAADTGTFVVTRSGDTSNPLTVYYAVAGTPSSGVPALHGVDYEALPGSLVIPAGATQAAVTILPRFDAFGEGPESVVLSLGAGSTNYILGSPSAATVTIADATSDVPSIDVVNISSASEPSTAGTFRITCRGGTGTGSLAVSYALSGTATLVTDYNITGTSNTTTGTTITLNNGATVTKDVVVTPVNDTDLEDLESVTLTITPSAAYTSYAPTSAATMWLRDNDQPTVYVDTQVGTSGSSTVTEGTVSTPTKFYVSRTGSTTAALTVNYTTAGTATPDSDYTALSGSVIIPAGSLGVDVPVTITNDTTFEGTETIEFEFAPGAYADGPGAVIYLADNDTATNTVAFQSPSSAGLESVTTVNIPVTLTPSSASPVTVQYAVSATTSSATPATSTTHALPYWVRVTRNGSTITYFESNDGVNWTQRGSTVSLPNLSTTTYYAGLAVASGSATSTAATIDSFTVSGLAGGGATGSESGVNLGNASGGTHSAASGVYSFNTPGNGILSNSTADNFRFVYVPVTNSTTCTVTARIVSLGTSTANARIGVMLRHDVTGQGAIYAASLANGTAGFLGAYRFSGNGASNSPSTLTSPVLPMWFKLVRAGDVFSTAFSKDGATWTSIGTTPTIAFGPTAVAGLAVSSRSDGTLTTATFDNVSITPTPPGALQGRTVGFVNAEGSETFSGGVWTVNGSGSGIGGTNDEAHFVASEVTGDFTLIGRVAAISGGATNAQAGVMLRQDRTHYARQMYAGFVASGSMEQQYRAQSATTAFGSGVDFLCPPGTLIFNPGETTKNLTFTVIDDNVREPNNLVTLQLLNPAGAAISSTATYHGYTIVDDDTGSPQPFAGFAASASTVSEGAGAAGILVSLTAPSASATSIDYAITGGSATDGTDYMLAAGTLSFPPGETLKSIPLTITADTNVEPSETIAISLSNPMGLQPGSLSAHTLTITDDDFPTVNLAATDAAAAESGDTGAFTFTRMGSLVGNLVVNFTRTGTATSGSDFAAIATPGTATILDGQPSATVTVTPNQDTNNEGNETVILTLTATPATYTLGTSTTATVTIADDDRSTVTIVANDPGASETAGNPGQFTLTRTAPTTASLTVNLTTSGTATSGSLNDYTTNPATVTTVAFTAGQSTRTIDILPVDDSATEGPEDVTISIAAGSYDIGAASYDNVTIADNDNPPTLFISSPTAQGPLIANGNGVILTATVTDDGAPQPVALAWTQAAGPGTATIESPTNANTAVTFSAPGSYVLRITATDGQFTVSDQVTVVVGSSIVAADWITQDLGPSSARRGQGLQFGNLFTVSGTGAGYAAVTTDQAHVMVRSVDGDATIVARVTNLPTTGALAGITMRDSMARAARRAVLGYVPGTGLQFRTRTTASTADTVATQAGITLPIWLKLERNATTSEITASYATDAAGSPATWTAIGATTVITMDARADIGLTATSNSTATVATAVLDNVSLTPAPSGPALISEDNGASPAAAGRGSFAGGTYTIVGSTSGYFHGWQFYGDLMITARLASMNSGAGSAIAGIRIAESIESGAYAHMGRIPTGAYSGYVWTSIAGGAGGGVPSGVSVGNWVRIVRNGNSITAYRAADSGGNPGTWSQIGQPQTIIMTTPVFAGFFVNNASGVGMNTCTFTGLSIVPQNKAPIVDAGSFAASVNASTPLNGSASDDDFPAPPGVTTLWSAVSGPASVAFGTPAALATTATFTADGAYSLRLRASDGSVESFDQVTLTASVSAFAQWQDVHFPGGSNNASAAPGADPDSDGLNNFLEFSMNTNPNAATTNPIVQDLETIGDDRYLRLAVPKNPSAAGITYTVEATATIDVPASWSSTGLIIEENTAASLRVRDNVPMSTAGPRFMRVRVSQ